MTELEAESLINNMPRIYDVCVEALPDKGVCLTVFECDFVTASDLRAIADILDQVGKEDGKAGEG